jgi:hypothetical protein
LTVVVCVTPPPVAVMVMVWFPRLAPLATLTVMVEVPEPGAAMELGLKVTLSALGRTMKPDGAPEKVSPRLIAELKPPEIVVVIVEVPELPLATLMDEGDALMVKLALVPVTVRDTVVVSVVLPEVPVTVTLYVPGTVDAATAIVMVEVPGPVIELGLKLTVTPVGWPVADKEMAESKPSVTVLVMVDVPELPCVTETEVGEAERLNPGVDELPARALSRPLPFGLPQPVAKS